MIKTLIAAVTLGAALVPAAASATVLTFDAASSGGFTQYTESGYKLTGNLFGTGGGIGNSYTTQAITVSRVDNALFTLASIAVGDWYTPDYTSMDITFRFVDANGTTSYYEPSVDIGPGVMTTLTNLTSAQLKSFSIYNVGAPYGNGYVKIDNVTVNAVAAAVPEPATWAMMVIGFGVAGAAVRRRKVSVRFA